MKYIVHHRIKGDHISGYINLPRGTVCKCKDGFITYDGKPICRDTSLTADMFFAIDEDGYGLMRGELTHAIAFQTRQRIADSEGHIARFTAGEQDLLREKYKRFLKSENPVLFNYNFFHGSIADLSAMANELKIKINGGI